MLNLMVAACEGGGIGKNGTLPWKIPSEMKYFTKMTKSTRDEGKRNAVIMGRLTFESIPEKFRPLKGRLNVVLTGKDGFDPRSDDVLVCKSLKVSHF